MSGDSFGMGIMAQLGGGSNGGADGMARRLDAILQKGRGGAAGYAVVGHRAMFLVSRGLRTNIGAWPSPSGWPRAFRRGGQPLLDTRRLSSSIAYRASSQGVAIGTNVEYARILNRGGTIHPKGRFLLLPLSPPLSRSEVRAWPRGKAGIQGRYPGSVFLMHGPEGPGIYRKSRLRTGTNIRGRSGKLNAAPSARYAAGTKSVERIAAAVRKVTIRKHGYLQWRPEWVRDVAQRYAQWFFDPKLANPFPAAGGNPDVGRKG